MSLERPTLCLGLIGFSAAQHEYLSRVLKTRPSTMEWQTVPFADADAWWVNGARIKRLDSGTVRVPPADPSSPATQLNLGDVNRPVAFSLPIAPHQIEPLFSFDPQVKESMGAVLLKFEAWLKPFVARFALAGAIASQEGNLRPGVYHLMLGGELLAVVNLSGDVGLAPNVDPDDLEFADWIGQPSSGKTIPENFVRTSLSQLMWQFAVRTKKDLLPQHYRRAQLYFRRSPRVAHRLLKDTHLVLIRELALAPGSFEELQDRTGMGQAVMARALAALYFVGGVTSNPKRAAPSRGGPTDGVASSQHSLAPSQLEADSVLSPSGAGRRYADRTAPAPLDIRP